MITAANLHAAIKRADSSLLIGRRGSALIDTLPNIALALSIIMGDCCQDCGHAIYAGKAAWIGGRFLCLPCANNALADNDKAEPTGPFMGGGQRVIRKTGGMS